MRKSSTPLTRLFLSSQKFPLTYDPASTAPTEIEKARSLLDDDDPHRSTLGEGVTQHPPTRWASQQATRGLLILITLASRNSTRNTITPIWWSRRTGRDGHGECTLGRGARARSMFCAWGKVDVSSTAWRESRPMSHSFYSETCLLPVGYPAYQYSERVQF